MFKQYLFNFFGTPPVKVEPQEIPQGTDLVAVFAEVSKELKLETIVSVTGKETDKGFHYDVKSTNPGALIGVGGSTAHKIKVALFQRLHKHSTFTATQHIWYED